MNFTFFYSPHQLLFLIHLLIAGTHTTAAINTLLKNWLVLAHHFEVRVDYAEKGPNRCD
jgi:hypothetical protein